MTIHTSSMTDVTHYGALLQQATDLGLKVVGASIMNDDDNQSLSVSDMLPMSEILFQVGKQHGQEEMEVLNMGSVLNLEVNQRVLSLYVCLTTTSFLVGPSYQQKCLS